MAIPFGQRPLSAETWTPGPSSGADAFAAPRWILLGSRTKQQQSLREPWPTPLGSILGVLP